MTCSFRLLTMMTWVPHAWDPMTGCGSKIISEGCLNCIARWQMIHSGSVNLERCDFEPTLHPEEFNRPIEVIRPHSVFVVPQGDFFHESFSFKTMRMLLDVMRAAPQHIYYFLTKRHERMHRCLTGYRYWPLPNVNVGVTAENRQRLNQRLPVLLDIPVHETSHRFVSCEPLLGPISVGPRIRKLGAVICGMERGCINKRIGKMEWLESLRTECEMVGIPFFHHGSGDIEREQRPRTDIRMRERQVLQRLREYQNRGNPISKLKEIAAQEGWTLRELSQHIGSEVAAQGSNIYKGFIKPGSYQKIWDFIDNYHATKGERYAVNQ